MGCGNLLPRPNSSHRLETTVYRPSVIENLWFPFPGFLVSRVFVSFPCFYGHDLARPCGMHLGAS